jgi:hypothetical protein
MVPLVKGKVRPGMVHQAYNPSYLRGGNQKDCSLGKKFARSHLNQWLGVVVHACHPSYGGMQFLQTGGRKIAVQADQSTKQDSTQK